MPKKKINIHKHKQKQLIIAAGLIIAVIVIFLAMQMPLQTPQTETTESDILEIGATSRQVSSFISENPDYTANVTKLSPTDIADLSKTYPAIYGELPSKTLYKIDYSFGDKGYLVIIDPQTQEILKEINAITVQLTL